MGDKYPEHKKLNNPNYQGVEMFANWLQETGHLVVSEHRDFAGHHVMIVKTKEPQQLVYEFFEVDKDKLEKERQLTLRRFLKNQEAKDA
jgi:hypothetical protein